MAYPPPNPGYPGYPPTAGGAGSYPPQQPSPWMPGGSAAPYPSQSAIPTPGGGAPVLGFGADPAPSTAGYPQNTNTYPPPSSQYPPISGPPSSYPPQPATTYPPPPLQYPPTAGPPSSYPPQPATTYPPPPSQYPPTAGPPSYPPPQPTSYHPPPSQYPPASGPPSSYPLPPSQPTAYSGGYPPSGGFPQQAPTGGFPQQPTTNYYVDGSSTAASFQTPPTNQPPPTPPTHQMAGVSLSSKTEAATSSAHHQASSTTSTKTPREVPLRGTVKRHSPFDAEQDAKTLRKAMKGFGTDEKAIITVLAYRSNAQRQEIKLKYKTIYGKDLIADLKSEISGNFSDVVLGLLMKPAEYDAAEVYKAIKGLGTDESTLIEVLCTRTSEEILALKRQYKSDYGREVEGDVSSDTSRHFKRFLISLLTGARERDSVNVDHDRAMADARALYQAGEAKWGTDESKFNEILASRSFSHLRAVFHEYSKICKYDIEQSISREMSGDLKTSMLTVVKCVKDKATYFAERLYRSMKGLGTDDHTLVRVMVTRCEVDMEDIKDRFYQNYRKSLGSFIKGDTSGDYRRILMALARADD